MLQCDLNVCQWVNLVAHLSVSVHVDVSFCVCVPLRFSHICLIVYARIGICVCISVCMCHIIDDKFRSQ